MKSGKGHYSGDLIGCVTENEWNSESLIAISILCFFSPVLFSTIGLLGPSDIKYRSFS